MFCKFKFTVIINSNFILLCLQDDFLLRHYDKGPCKNKLGHSRASVIWHRTQVCNSVLDKKNGLLSIICDTVWNSVGLSV